MTKNHAIYRRLLWFVLVLATTSRWADPITLIPGVEIRQVMNIGRDNVRIARNPADVVLHILCTDGSIRAIDVKAGTARTCTA